LGVGSGCADSPCSSRRLACFPPSTGRRTAEPTSSRPDLQAAIDALHATGARKVFVVGASFGGAAALRAAAKLHGAAGFVSLSGELDLPTTGNVLPAVRRLREPLLVVASRRDSYLDAADAGRLVGAAGSSDKAAGVVTAARLDRRALAVPEPARVLELPELRANLAGSDLGDDRDRCRESESEPHAPGIGTRRRTLDPPS
jgi:pimeloyl-ACP methyl ester carboxylesterase